MQAVQFERVRVNTASTARHWPALLPLPELPQLHDAAKVAWGM